MMNPEVMNVKPEKDYTLRVWFENMYSLTAETHDNPGGVSQQSEGLRVFALPWKCHANNNQPRWGCLFPGLSRAKWATLPGLMIFSYAASRVARIRATLRFVGKPLRGCKPMNTGSENGEEIFL